MIKNCLLLFFALLYSSDGTVLTIENRDYSLHDFFSRYPQKQWERADSLQKEKMVDDFIRRELCVLEARHLGFQNNPEIAVKIYNRSLQVLVNESYEYFVAKPLIPPEDIVLARINAKREVFVSHILIGHAGSSLSRPLKRTNDEALLLCQQIKRDFVGGENFAVLAEKHSDDPGVSGDFGEVGWVRWGATVPEFQVVAFSLEFGVLSAPVLTKFGYHLILVSDERPSDFHYMDDDVYESLIINITKNSIRDLLRPAAIEYDQKMIEEYGVVFDMNTIQEIMGAYNLHKKDVALSGGPSSLSFLETFDQPSLVCVYNKKGYGPKWFARHLDRAPSSRQPSLDSEEIIVSTFKTILLQDIAINKGSIAGVDSSFSYQWKVDDMVSGLLYDAYLKHLVNTVPDPDSLSVKAYYESNKNKKYLEEEKITIREINVSNRLFADSLLMLINSGYDFSYLFDLYGFLDSLGVGVIGPFSRKQKKNFFDAAILLDLGGVSPVLSSFNNSFSIIQLVEKLPLKPIELSIVYAQIESLLIKDGQDNSKENGINGLLNKYSVKKTDLLSY